MAWSKFKRRSRARGQVLNANFNPSGNCNVNWNLKSANVNPGLGVRSVVVSDKLRGHPLRDAFFYGKLQP